MMITPMAASMPCTTDVGKNSFSPPDRNSRESDLQETGCHAHAECQSIRLQIRGRIGAPV